MSIAEEEAARFAAAEEQHRQLLAKVDHPALRAIVELHHPSKGWPWPECRGDEFGGYEAERPGWPCDTIDVLLNHYAPCTCGHPRSEHATPAEGDECWHGLDDISADFYCLCRGFKEAATPSSRPPGT